MLIAEDALAVTLLPSEEGVPGHTPAELLAWLASIGVRGIDTGAVHALAGPEGQIAVTEPTVLLRGRAAMPERPGSVALLSDSTDSSPSDSMNHYDRTAHLQAKLAGQAIAIVTPPTPGQDGVDVFGQPIAHARVQVPVELGRNVELDADGVTVRATAPGRVLHRGKKLWIETAVTINGDVDFSCGNIDVGGDVTVSGSVLDLFKVRGANIRIGGAVEASDINAAGDLHVAGGILGKDKGQCAAGGDVTFKYASNASIVATGDVHARGEVSHSRINCRGRLVMEGAPLTSGHIIANGGIECASLGSPIETRMLVEVGIDEFLRAAGPEKLAEITARRAKASHLKSTAAQILRFRNNLSVRQKEQTTELLYDAAQAQAAAEEILRPLREQLAASRARQRPEVVISGMLHAGVTIRFPNAETTIHNTFAGPLRVVALADGADGEPRIALIDTRENTTQALVCKRWHDPAYDTFVRAIEQ